MAATRVAKRWTPRSKWRTCWRSSPPGALRMAADSRAGTGAKSLARKRAMQALYRLQLNEAPWQDLVQEFATEEGMDRADDEYFRELIQAIHGARLALDADLAAWMDRSPALLDPIEHAVLLIGTY